MFVSCKGGPLDASGVHRIVKAAAERAGLSAEVSACWLHHAHASDSLDRGAPIHRCSRCPATLISLRPVPSATMTTTRAALQAKLMIGSRIAPGRIAMPVSTTQSVTAVRSGVCRPGRKRHRL